MANFAPKKYFVDNSDIGGIKEVFLFVCPAYNFKLVCAGL
jgi:hypothetical protein